MKQTITIFLILSCATLFAQPFIEANPAPSFLAAEEPALAFNDVDSDGDLDVFIIGGFDDQTKSDSAILYLNDGLGNFTEVLNTPFQGLFECSLAFVDVNGDDHDDLITTGSTDSQDSSLYQ